LNTDLLQIEYNKFMVEEYFFKNLSYLLERDSLKQSHLAKKTGIPQSTIKNWFSRKSLPSSDALNKLAIAFNVKPHYFFMEPGSQELLAPVTGKTLNKLLDRLAHEHLTEREYNDYLTNGGVEGFTRILVKNLEHETSVEFPEYFLILNKELHKYISMSLMENLRVKLRERDNPKKADAS